MGAPGSEWIDDLDRATARAYKAGISDKDLAYALMATRCGHPIDSQLAEHADLVFKLAWLLNVRAPGLDLRWLIKGVLATDRVYWEVLPLGRLLDRLRALELAAAEEHGDVEQWLTLPRADPDTDPIRAAAANPDRIGSASGDELREQVASDIAMVQRCVKQGDLLQLIGPQPRN